MLEFLEHMGQAWDADATVLGKFTGRDAKAEQ
jgi:hypothetical protein